MAYKEMFVTCSNFLLLYKHCLEKCQECDNLLPAYQIYGVLQSNPLSSTS